MMRIYLSGAHANRSPLSYSALSPLFEARLKHCEMPQEADIYLFAHILDIQNAPASLVLEWRRSRRPIVLLSEEPFWDTIWGRQPLQRNIRVETDFGFVPVVQLNHATCDIFDFDHIPYYLLTNHRFANTYMARFQRNAGRSLSQWRQHFATCSVDLTFMFERRPEAYHAVTWPEADIIGLCSWRTELAQSSLRGQVERLGQSWQQGKTRFQLRNWYLDKMTRLDGRSRILAAFENTHQPAYITEKIFDAFACGSVPLYVASPKHRLHEFGIPASAWVNLYGLDPAACIHEMEMAIEALQMGGATEHLEAFSEAQACLATRFQDVGLWVAERHRLVKQVDAALREVLDSEPST